ncbi:acyltransferase family protein [Spirosoma endbachense]|uniref:Acyltransferase family protein n=1 Tax=Spirosoma endbachense TaxID=2666025 RepID=A0A6P1W8E0_9BACT|nr:acyltransferase family protein [Spirosoma endbachense]QHV99956.1 acyltransferase family protein [Spirosoma endbachense]
MNNGNARAIWLDYLRSFVTLLVVAHHAALAYPTFAHFDPAHYIYSTAPIVDDNRWKGMDYFIGFNDLFFMPLMFLISGLFVYRGLAKKGVKAYLRDRFIRLGVPFLIAEVLLIPLAYVPSFYEATHSTDVATFVRDYIMTQQWPVGPPWFIWLLLAFDGIGGLIFKYLPSFFLTVGNGFADLSKRPVRLFAVIYALVALSLIPLSLWVGQYTWVGHWGPFDFQLNRLFFYWLFFLAGSCLGATDWQNYLFKQNKLFGKGWPFWFGLSLVCYVLFVMISRLGEVWVRQGKLSATEGYFMYDLFFVASCLTSMSACLSYFKQTITRPIKGWSSLSANAYGIYVVHYGFVTWLQFALLNIDLPVVVKFLIVFSGALILSWLCSRLARRSSFVAQIL